MQNVCINIKIYVEKQNELSWQRKSGLYLQYLQAARAFIKHVKFFKTLKLLCPSSTCRFGTVTSNMTIQQGLLTISSLAPNFLQNQSFLAVYLPFCRLCGCGLITSSKCNLTLPGNLSTKQSYTESPV